MAILNIRNVPNDTAVLFRRAAAIRGMTLAQYLTALTVLHVIARVRAVDDPNLEAELIILGLQSIKD